MRAEAAPVGANWHLQLPGGQTVSLAPPYRPVSRWLRPEPSTLLDPEHGLVPFLGRQPVMNQITGWCQGPPGTPVLLVTGGGGSGKTRLGREACVQMMLVAGWDTGLADDQGRGGTPTDRLQRPTLLVVDDADLHTGLIAALINYRRRDEDGPPVRLLLARAAGEWWDRLVRQERPANAYKLWTWTAIPSRPLTGPSTSAAPVTRSPPTAPLGGRWPTCRRSSWMIRRTPNRC